MKVLLVDDEKYMLLAMREVVKRLGLDSDSAENVKEAKQLIKENNYNLIISDIKMPGEDGIALLEHIRQISLNIPVILITAYGKVGDAVNAMKLGAYDYIQKPFSAVELEMIIKRTGITHNMEKKFYKVSSDDIIIVSRNQKIRDILNILDRAAKSDATILIEAESGTGKELFARYIHYNSPRAKNNFVAVNCASVPDNLLESELFGYKKGSFTGAANDSEGKFKLADKGTLLLDEIGEMSSHLQSKLLRVLQEKEIDVIGGKIPLKVDVRVIATTNRDLQKMVKEGKFREDLYFRLNVIKTAIPPLRERKDDIPCLIDHFLDKYSKADNTDKKPLMENAMQYLCNYSFPGNVRELENTIRRGLIISQGKNITLRDLNIQGPIMDLEAHENLEESDLNLKEVEKKLIFAALNKYTGNRTKAANVLGITVRTLRNKLNEYKEMEAVL